MQEALSGLKDIHLPPPVGWWPPAPGWWLLAALGLLVLYSAWRIWRKRRRRRALHDEALAEQAQQTLAAGLGKEALMPGFPPVMGSEDFPMLVAGIEDARTLFMEVGGGAPDVTKVYMETGKLPPLNHNPKFEIKNPALAITTAVKAGSMLLLDSLKPKG